MELKEYLKTLTNEELNAIREVLIWAEVEGGTNDETVCNIMKEYFDPRTTLDKLEPYIEEEIQAR